MNSKDISEAISAIDSDIVDSAEKKRAEQAGLVPKKGAVMHNKFLISAAAVAACAVLTLGVWKVAGRASTEPKIDTEAPQTGVWKAPNNGVVTDINERGNEPAVDTAPPPAAENTVKSETTPSTEPAPITEPNLTTEPSKTTNTPSTQPTEREYEEPVMLAEFEKIDTIALASYPKASPYPSREFANESWGHLTELQMTKPWEEDKRTRNGAAKNITDISDFYNATAQQFLTNSDGENRVYSPLSIYVCLAMLAETADGNSRDQILELLECESIEALRENIYNIWNGNYRNDGATVSILANSIWLNESIAYKQPTLDTLAEKYYASSFSGDMSKEDMTLALRAWLNLQTGGLLENSVEQLKLDPLTVIALCNTVYFRAKWDWHFLKEYNDIKTFHSPSGDIETEFMNSQSDNGPYYWGEDYGAIALSFADGGYMWLILPDEDKTVDDVLNSGEYLDMVKESWQWEKRKTLIVNYSVPKFDISCDTDLVEGLMKLGITDVFDTAKSDFSSLTDTEDICVGQVKHSARVVIDEEGCTAAAFTAMLLCGAAMPHDEKMDFVLDRPFIFVIDNGSKQPLFTGVVNNPR